MAISQMRQLSLLLPKELLDQLLFYLQGLKSVQIHDLRQEEDWQAAFEQALVGRPISIYLSRICSVVKKSSRG